MIMTTTILHCRWLICLLALLRHAGASPRPAFVKNGLTGPGRSPPRRTERRGAIIRPPLQSTVPLRAATDTTDTDAKPRSGFAQKLLDLALASPLWTHVMVPRARATMVETAEANGISWMAAREWLRSSRADSAPWNAASVDDASYPEYYKKSFHAYEEGNLSYDAAFEQEIASRAVGARNFPRHGSRGEDVFRGAFDAALSKLGARIANGVEEEAEEEAVIVDFGCGTGTSTRRLAAQYPRAARLIGIDLSPYFVDVGRTLLEMAPLPAMMDDDDDDDHQPRGWITAVDADPRVELRRGDIARTGLPSDYASVVNLVFVLHELPAAAAREVVLEAHRILKPGGQLWICEMDFESPAYRAQRENALLFSLLRATEPYLDEYADGMPELRNFIADTFARVKITAATGRHYSLVAEKGVERNDGASRASLEDTRFLKDGSYAIEDTHLKPWESKEDE